MDELERKAPVVIDGAEGPTRMAKPVWRKPEITAYVPTSEARGISFRPGDGFSNLC